MGSFPFCGQRLAAGEEGLPRWVFTFAVSGETSHLPPLVLDALIGSVCRSYRLVLYLGGILVFFADSWMVVDSAMCVFRSQRNVRLEF